MSSNISIIIVFISNISIITNVTVPPSNMIPSLGFFIIIFHHIPSLGFFIIMFHQTRNHHNDYDQNHHRCRHQPQDDDGRERQCQPGQCHAAGSELPAREDMPRPDAIKPSPPPPHPVRILKTHETTGQPMCPLPII